MLVKRKRLWELSTAELTPEPIFRDRRRILSALGFGALGTAFTRAAARSDEMPGWYGSRRVFPYYEALTYEEATNELAFVATGIYGHPLPQQHGAPIRLVLPWEYGFKSAKSIVAIQFTDERPGTFWNTLSPKKYSWSANVDPTEIVPWPQAEETMLGSETRRPSTWAPMRCATSRCSCRRSSVRC